jgi:hypothetical protein
MRWRANNVNQESFAGLTGSILGQTISLGAIAPGGILQVSMQEPAGGWAPNTIVQINSTNFPTSAMTYSTSAELTYSTEVQNSSATFNVAYVSPVAGGVIAGTFTATLFSEDSNQPINIQNGEFLILLN